ncbi:MAG: DUF262 domain-containing protein [Pseudomonadota bacterium]
MESKTLTVQEILDLRKSNMLYVNPEYQRGQVWTLAQKKRLIDSVLRGYPLPLIYLNHIKRDVAGMQREDLEIIDGQQRINSLFEYREGVFKLFDPKKDDKEARFPQFIVDMPCPWAGCSFEALSSDLKTSFLETKLPVVKITIQKDVEARDLFIRLQAGLPLNAQEKRDAWPGGFTDFILRFAGKPEITRYQGHEFFSKLIGGQVGSARGKARQLCAQMAMLLFELRRNGSWIDLRTQSIDDYYYKHLDFDPSGLEALRFSKALDMIVKLLGDGMRRKLKAHEAIHLMLLVDSLIDDYTVSWQTVFAAAFDKFTDCVNKDKRTRNSGNPGEFWANYDVHTRTNSAAADTIRVRHKFFSKKMFEFLSPLTLRDPNRQFGQLEREIIYYRENKRCVFCGETIIWTELDIHHVDSHSQGGTTTLDNGRAVHRICHPRGKQDSEKGTSADSLAQTTTSNSVSASDSTDLLQGATVDGRLRPSTSTALPPDGTICRFRYGGQTQNGRIENRTFIAENHGVFRTFSGASCKITGTSRNGWRDWEIQLPGTNDWILADTWRSI